MTGHPRCGMTLLEVLVALAILGTAGLATVTLATESWRAVRAAREADRSFREASAFFDAVALWPREDLDRHLGDRAQGPWGMRVDRPLPTLYVVTLVDTAGGMTLLSTSLFRPEPRHATP
jgi:prepilin-type N-terminal cleavage/methylation domain-containing protein